MLLISRTILSDENIFVNQCYIMTLWLVIPNVTISHMRMPKLQTSDLGVKTLKYNDSGAIQRIGNAPWWRKIWIRNFFSWRQIISHNNKIFSTGNTNHKTFLTFVFCSYISLPVSPRFRERPKSEILQDRLWSTRMFRAAKSRWMIYKK